MPTVHLEIVTPERVVVSEDVNVVVAPGAEGEFGVLEGHVPFLSSLLPGELRYKVGDETEWFAVGRGFAEVSNDNVTVLVDSAERGKDIDLQRAREAMERAKERLAMERSREDVDFTRAEAALQRALVRIKVAEKAQ